MPFSVTVGYQHFYFPHVSFPVMEPSLVFSPNAGQSHTHLQYRNPLSLNFMGTRGSFPGSNWLGHVTDHSPPSRLAMKSRLRGALPPLQSVVVWWLVKHRYNFTCYFTAKCNKLLGVLEPQLLYWSLTSLSTGSKTFSDENRWMATSLLLVPLP